MNSKQRLAALKRTPDRVRKFELENETFPETGFDGLIKGMLEGLRWIKTNPCHAVTPTAGQTEMQAWGEYVLAQWGYTLADAVRRGDSEMFRDLATAIDTWKGHKPNPAPHKLRLLLIQFCDPAKSPFTVREIKKYLKSQKYPIDYNTEKYIGRQCKLLGFTIKGKAGRPPKELGQQALKSR